MSKIVVMCGIAASGKSHIAREIAKNYSSDNIVILSSDEFRKQLLGDEEDQSNNSKVFEEMYKVGKEYLKQGKDIIFDSTNLSMKRRMALIRNFRKNASEFECVVVLTSLEDIFNNNKKRLRHVPKEAIMKQLKNFQFPQFFEGWDKITVYINSKKMENVINILSEKCDIPHDNPHHTLSVKKHMLKAYQHSCKYFPSYKITAEAALFHDIGKPYCKFFDKNGIAHYYGHQNLSAYLMACDKFFELNETIKTFSRSNEIFLLIFLINYHMEYLIRDGKGYTNLLMTINNSYWVECLDIIEECDEAAH